MNDPINNRLAVCSWSLQPDNPQTLAERIRQTGIQRIQLALDPLYQNHAVWGDAVATMKRNGIAVVSAMVTCQGEDYSTLESIRRTGGITPDDTWERNRQDFEGKARLAADLGITLVTLHAGFLPHDPADPLFGKMLSRLEEAARIFAAHHISLALETGQETAADLVQVLRALKQPNVRVNFDPANMILYAKGNPIEAVRGLAPWIAQVHLKDARAAKVPGTWGDEVPLGSGDVDWPGFCATLNEIGFGGDLVIEREAGGDRIADVRLAREVISQIFQRIGSAQPPVPQA